MEEADELSLPADTLKILHEFLLEKSQREQDELEKIKNKAGKESKFEEDWQLSQFWYNETTKKGLGSIVKNLKKENDDTYKIALLSCPSLYATVKEIHENVKIFEYDRRFSAFGDDFVFYDINAADTPNYLQDQTNSFDLIIADPPFLSEDCIHKISKIVEKLQRPTTKIIFCSGQVVEPWLKIYLNLKKCNFRPEHERNLGNEFVSYANFDLDNFVES